MKHIPTYTTEIEKLSNITYKIVKIVNNPIRPPWSFIKPRFKIDSVNAILHQLISDYKIPEQLPQLL